MLLIGAKKIQPLFYQSRIPSKIHSDFAECVLVGLLFELLIV